MRGLGWITLLLVLWSPTAWAHPPVEVTVSRVLDGDTADVVLTTGTIKRVRLIGLNAPELHEISPCGRRWALAAKAALMQMVQGQTVRLVFDQVAEDRYQRWLAWAYVGERFLNVELVAQGLARYSNPGRNTAYRALVQAAEAAARQSGVGMWRTTADFP